MSTHLAEKYRDAKVSTFSLPDWDFTKKEIKDEFIALLHEVNPEFVWIAPPCRKWSTMKRLTKRSLKR